MSEPLLEVIDLQTHFHTEDGVVRAVDGVSYALQPGETLAVVGESGSGKSVTALSILRLIASPPGRIESGRIVFRGRDLLALPESEMRDLRGRAISMIFQEPMTSLNPVHTCGEQVAEVVRLHERVDRAAARAREKRGDDRAETKRREEVRNDAKREPARDFLTRRANAAQADHVEEKSVVEAVEEAGSHRG